MFIVKATIPTMGIEKIGFYPYKKYGVYAVENIIKSNIDNTQPYRIKIERDSENPLHYEIFLNRRNIGKIDMMEIKEGWMTLDKEFEVLNNIGRI